MNLAAAFYHKLYKSNFFLKPTQTQRDFEAALKEFLEEYEKDKNKR